MAEAARMTGRREPTVVIELCLCFGLGVIPIVTLAYLLSLLLLLSLPVSVSGACVWVGPACVLSLSGSLLR